MDSCDLLQYFRLDGFGIDVDTGVDFASAAYPEGSHAAKQTFSSGDGCHDAGNFIFTILTFTPVGTLIGLTALPLSYFGFLVVIVLLYLLFVTLAKGRYLKKYHELL